MRGNDAMLGRHGTIQVQPGTELAHVLEAAAETALLLEKDGVRYRLHRLDLSDSNPAPRARRQPRAYERVLEIIGLGSSAAGSNVALHKDRYLADAADHREG